MIFNQLIKLSKIVLKYQISYLVSYLERKEIKMKKEIKVKEHQ